MTALGIITTWLTLTGAGFAGLSALRRAGAREGIEAGLTAPTLTTMMRPLSELRAPMLADARVPIPEALLP
jgi:hypothetical protein